MSHEKIAECDSPKNFLIHQKCISCENVFDCNNKAARFFPYIVLSYSGLSIFAIISALKIFFDWSEIIKRNPIAASIVFVFTLLSCMLFIIILSYQFRKKIIFFKNQVELLLKEYVCRNNRACKGLKFNIDAGILEEISEFEVMLKNGSADIISSRSKYLKIASELRYTEMKSYHVMYLTKNSLEVYKHEDWLKSEDTNTQENRQRIIVIDKSTTENKSDMIAILESATKTSNVKIITSESIENINGDYKKLLKDFGIFILPNHSKSGLFTVANIYNLNHAKYVFSMLTETFYCVHHHQFLDEYERLFLTAWEDQTLTQVDINSFKVLPKAPMQCPTNGST